MKSGAILANSGHFNHEINIDALRAMTRERRQLRPFVDEHRLTDGRSLILLAEGRLVNLAAAEGHPASVMDMSFANQALSVEYLLKSDPKPEPGVWPVPLTIDRGVAEMKLAATKVVIDTLTADQEEYLRSWESGT